MIQKKIWMYLESIDPLQVSWIVFNEKGEIKQTTLHSNLSNLSPDINNYDVTLIVPASDVLLTTANLPKLSRQRLLQALPFALEEQLIDDVTLLHFALANTKIDGVFPVCIVKKQTMQDWITLLKEHNLQPTYITSAVFALPIAENNWTVLIDRGICTLRIGPYEGYACDIHNIVILLEWQLAETINKPDTLTIYYFPPDPIPNFTNEHNLKINKIALSDATFLTRLAEWSESHPSINLLQNTYQAKRKSSEIKKIWFAALGLALGWLGVLLISNLISLAILHHQAAPLETAINKIYKQQFPHATSIVAPQKRLEQKLKQLTGQTNKNDFLVLLAETGESLASMPAVHLVMLAFHDNQLSLDLSAPTFNILDTLKKMLSQQGLLVKQQNAAITNGKVNATFLIERGNI